MSKKNEQNQLLNIDKFLSEGKIELAIKIADDNIKNKISPIKFLKFIKKILIKNQIIDKNPSVLKLENIFNEQKFACAKYYFQMHVKIFFKNPKALLIAGKVHSELDELNEALKYFKEALRLEPDNLKIRKYIANFHISIGNIEEAIENFNYLAEKDPFDGENHRLLSRTKRYSSEDDSHIKQMEKLLTTPNITLEQKINLSFGLGNVYETLKLYEKSSKYYKVGNFEQNKRLDFDFNKEKHIAEQIIETYSRDVIKKNQSFVERVKEPIFILGMPRSGTSLVEQILSTHKDVFGGGELSFIEDYLLKNRGSIGLRMPEILSNPNKENIKNFHNFYYEKIKYLNFNANYITDKMPGNFKWIGLIKSAFPNSKIIHLIRDKRDTCFSIYKSYFANDTCSYSYDPKNIVDFYNLYSRVMKSWKNIFGDEIYDCEYEKLVDNFEIEAKKILNYCQLDWDDEILSFFKNKRRVITVSTVQVRENIYKSSINSWLNYKNDLEKYFKKLV